jgi:hypothetical protein
MWAAMDGLILFGGAGEFQPAPALDARRRGFVHGLDRLAEHRSRVVGCKLVNVTIKVTERYARRRLGLRKDEPLMYRGLVLRCTGKSMTRIQR